MSDRSDGSALPYFFKDSASLPYPMIISVIAGSCAIKNHKPPSGPEGSSGSEPLYVRGGARLSFFLQT